MIDDNVKYLLALTKGEHTADEIAHRLDWDKLDVATTVASMETKGELATKGTGKDKTYSGKLEATPAPIEESIK